MLKKLRKINSEKPEKKRRTFSEVVESMLNDAVAEMSSFRESRLKTFYKWFLLHAFVAFLTLFAFNLNSGGSLNEFPLYSHLSCRE